MIGATGGNDKLPRIEIFLTKYNKKGTSPLLNAKNQNDLPKSSLEETRTNLDKNAAI
jgi:hypothetical protein